MLTLITNRFLNLKTMFIAGTSACPNGHFTCKNLGHKALDLQSSRVNDGVCGMQYSFISSNAHLTAFSLIP